MELHKRLLFTAVSLGAIFYLFVKISLGYWKRRGILHKKPNFLYGNLKGICRKKHISEILHCTYQEYKKLAPFIGFYAYLKPYVLVLDLDVVQHILSIDSRCFMSRGLYNNIQDEPLSGNLMQLDGDKWQQLYEKVCPAFGHDRINDLVPHMLKVASDFRRSLETKQQLQENFIINDLVDCFSVDIISTLAFGLTGVTLQHPHSEFHAMTRSYKQNYNFFKALLALEFPVLARLLQYKSFDQLSSEYFIKIIGERLKEREWSRWDENPQQQDKQMNDFLNLFVEDNVKLSWSNKEIAAQAFSFILSGLVPLNTTLTFCLYELALQPELQDNARLEINKVLQRHNGKLSLAGLQELTYLRQILKETLRLHSPYPFLLRKTLADYEVPNSVYMLAQGNNVIIPIAAIHRDPDIYPEPTRFDPNRFQDASVHKRHSMSWLPFGAGPRGCIAARFAELTLLIGLVTLLENFHYAPCSDTPIPLEYDKCKLLVEPKSLIKLNVERINRSNS